MTDAFARQGDLQDISSYPAWAQDVAAACALARRRVAQHELFQRMRDARLDEPQIAAFLAGVWPVIEQFPQYMALNLLKVQFGRLPGHDEARRYLIRNIRVEQSHADHWLEWAQASGVAREQLLYGEVPPETQALAHWCWRTCERDPLAAGMAATNYAIEGVTGDWSALVCASDAYELTFPPAVRTRAMKWLRLHARYDDEHPWQALEIISMLLGMQPSTRDVDLIRSRVQTSYDYMRLTLDHCLDASALVSQPVPLEAAPPQRERMRA